MARERSRRLNKREGSAVAGWATYGWSSAYVVRSGSEFRLDSPSGPEMRRPIDFLLGLRKAAVLATLVTIRAHWLSGSGQGAEAQRGRFDD